MTNELTVPKVEIIENGVPVSQERIDPAVAQFIMAAAQTAQLVKIRKLAESAIPIGVKPLKLTITDTITKLVLDPPWISFSLINGAGSDLTVWVNDEDDPLVEGMVAASETYSCDMSYTIIRTLYLKAESGGTTTVRVYGKQGRPV